jgi:thymidylate synthase (FAD)
LNGGSEMSETLDAQEQHQGSALDDIIGKKLPVLDDGFVRLVDVMGDDSSIVQAARVSYGKGTKKISEDRGLIRYLLRHRHTTPFEMCEIKLHVRVPMDCWRQWIRHRTANVNEYSTRYSIAIDAAQTTKPDAWREQGVINRQGSEGQLDVAEGERLSKQEAEFHASTRQMYQERLDAGVAREQARKDLPLSTYTEAYWKVDLHNLLHFLALRMESHAQYEIREYANTIGHQIVAQWVPMAWEAFLHYRMNSMGLSEMEIMLLGLLFAGKQAEAVKWMEEWGWLKQHEGAWKLNIEANEFAGKLNRMNIELPWKGPSGGVF